MRKFFRIICRDRFAVTIIKSLTFSHLSYDECRADEVYTDLNYDEGNESRDRSSTRTCLQDAHTDDVIDT